MAKNPTFMQKGTRHTEHEQRHSIAHDQGRPQCQQLSANSINDETYHRADHRRFMRKHSRTRCDRTVPLKLGTLKTVEKGSQHSWHEVQRVSLREDCSEVQGQTRQVSKLIYLLEVEQICICVNKMNCDTADNEQEKSDEISNKVTSCGHTISRKSCGYTGRRFGVNPGWYEWYEWCE